ncbi:MAG: leucine-rich repeat domain-containing protein [Fimbriimonadaceae bacterium]|nr:leucine-rich repeat domain-containing protein [Fimbriimonadaceae bacterium]
MRLDRFDRSADLARELSAALQANEGGLVHVRGWERAFSGPEGPERLYRFNLLRETIFAPRTAQVWWMSEDFRNIFMRHAPDTWSFMQLRFSVAEADEYIELPPTLARIVRSQLGLRPNEQVTRKAWSSLDVLDLSFHAVGDPELAHLSSLTCIKTLFLGNTRISDTSPLSELTALKFLFLSDTRVADASPLAGLTALETLDLSGTQILDASPLSSLTALKSLLLS